MKDNQPQAAALEHLSSLGFVLKPRLKNANTAFSGKWMVTTPEGYDIMQQNPRTKYGDASELQHWCIVGNDPNELVTTTLGFFE
jgi:hypothetical protein